MYVGIAEWQAVQDFVNKVLEGLRSISKAKRHPQEFEEAKWSYYRCF